MGSPAEGPPFFCDIELARRIECEAIPRDRMGYQLAAAGRFPDTPPAALEVAGGVAFFNAPGSVLNSSLGLGLHGPVRPADLDELEVFYLSRGEPARLELCPLASSSLLAGLIARGWTIEGYENQLVVSVGDGAGGCAPYGRRVPQRAPDPRVTVRVVEPHERAEWGRVMAAAFHAPDEATPADLEIADVISHCDDATYVLAEVDGVPAGTGMVTFAGDVALLNADATLPEFRGLGAQTAIQALRLDLAEREGCEIVASEATPGSISQRNQERHGLRVAYTRTTWVRAPKRAIRPAGLRP